MRENVTELHDILAGLLGQQDRIQSDIRAVVRTIRILGQRLSMEAIATAASPSGTHSPGEEPTVVGGPRGAASSLEPMPAFGGAAPPKLDKLTASEARTHCRMYLESAGRPLNRGELYKLLTNNQLTLSGRNPRNYLGGVLDLAKDEFVNVKGYGYWVRDRDCPAVGYAAESKVRSN